MVRVSGRTAADRNVYDLSLEVSQPEPGIDFVVLDVTVDPERPVLGEMVEVCFDLVNLGGTTAPASTVRLHLSEDTNVDPVVDPLLASLDVPSFDARLVRCVDVRIPEDSGGGTRYIAVVADARDDVADELSETNNVSLSPAFEVDSSCFDLLEPNNDPDDPRPIELVAEPPVTLADLLVCSGNSDHYAFCVSDGDFLRLTATFDPGQGDVDLRLRDGAAEVDRSEGVSGTEQVEVDYVAGDRCYTLDVFVVGEGREVPYELEVDTGVAPEELVCSRIEEPNDEFDTARPLREFIDACPAICPVDDTDFYAVVLSAGTEIEVSLVGPDGTPPPDDVRLALFGPSRNFLASTVTATEVLRHTAALTGEYSLRVRANGAGPRDQPYCLTVEGLSGTDLVPSDFRLETGEGYAGDTVRFSFTLSNALDVASTATTYAVYLSSDAVISPDDTLLRVVELAPVEGLASREEGRRFDVPSELVDGGSYRVILRVDDEDLVDELREANNIAIEPFVVLPRCVPDAAEPNNFFADAAAAAAHVGVPLTSCGEVDADWFTFDGTGAETTVAIRFFDADGDLDLYVYEVTESGLVLAGFSDTITDDEVVAIDTDAEAAYAIEVRQHTDEAVPYTLEIE
jgi:hypothetical protein